MTVEPTDFTMGRRSHACRVCGTVRTEAFYPEGTYRRGNRGEGVKELQEKLNAAGYDCGKADGQFGGRTEEAVKALEEAYAFKADGIAWPGVQKWLGGTGEYAWEPPEEEEEPEEPEEQGAPVAPQAAAAVSEYANEYYNVSVTAEDTSDWKRYCSEKVPVKITVTNEGTEPVDVFVCTSLWSDENDILFDSWDAPYTNFYTALHSWLRAEHAPGESSTLWVRVPVNCEYDHVNDLVRHKVVFNFFPLDVIDKFGMVKNPIVYPWPENWPEPGYGLGIDLYIEFGFADPSLKLQAVESEGYYSVGQVMPVKLKPLNDGGSILYDWEADLYTWDKSAGDYVFRETAGSWEGKLLTEQCPASTYGIINKTIDYEVTEEDLGNAKDGMARIAFKARAWTKDGLEVESGLMPIEFGVFKADVYLEAEDTSEGQIREEGWVKVKLKAENLGTEVMSFLKAYCWNDGIGLPAEDTEGFELHDMDLDWFISGSSGEMELWIRVYGEDLAAKEVRRDVVLAFERLTRANGYTIPADASPEEAYHMGEYVTNEIEVVIPLLEAPEDPPADPPEAPKALDHCVTKLAAAGGGTVKWTLTRCPEHSAAARAANALLKQAEGGEAAAWEEVKGIWADALDKEYGKMLADADEAEKAYIEAERTCFEAYLDARAEALQAENADGVQAAKEAAALLMHKTALLCQENHASPMAVTALWAAAGETGAAGEAGACLREVAEMGATLRVTEAACAEHRSIGEMAAGASDADAWRQAKLAWLEELDGQADARWLAADGAGRALIEAERRALGAWLAACEAMLDALCPGDPAAVQEMLAYAVRSCVLADCGRERTRS